MTLQDRRSGCGGGGRACSPLLRYVTTSATTSASAVSGSINGVPFAASGETAAMEFCEWEPAVQGPGGLLGHQRVPQ